MCECASVRVCVCYEYRCQKRPEVWDFPTLAGVNKQSVVSHMMWVLRTKLQSSAKTGLTLNH